jgi:hypothetical protein
MGRRPHRRGASSWRRLAFEQLEDRRLLATLTVNSLLDGPTAIDGFVTLREAILAANADSTTELGETGSGADTIQFAAGLAGTIELSVIGDSGAGPSSLLISSVVTIEGSAGGITVSRDDAVTMRLFRVGASGDLTLSSIMLSDGMAQGGVGQDGRGGAIFVSAGGLLKIANSTLYNHLARGGSGGVGRGGAVYSDGGDVEIENATFSGNATRDGSGLVAGFGAGVYNHNGTLAIRHSTITSGLAGAGRAVYVFGDGALATVSIDHTILAQSDTSATDFVSTSENGGSQSASGAYNIIRTAPSFDGLTNTIFSDPLLESLTGNSGPTMTHMPQVGSPAVDAGNPDAMANQEGVPQFDQRGAPWSRVADGDDAGGARLDIGAVERQPAGVPPELPGDYNGDSKVSAADYTVWRNSLWTYVPTYSGADGNGSGQVDMGDYDTWKANYGEDLSEGSAASGLSTADAAMGAEPLADESVAAGTSAAAPPGDGSPGTLPPVSQAVLARSGTLVPLRGTTPSATLVAPRPAAASAADTALLLALNAATVSTVGTTDLTDSAVAKGSDDAVRPEEIVDSLAVDAVLAVWPAGAGLARRGGA